MLEAHLEVRLLDLADARRLHQLCQVSLACAGEVGLALDAGVELAHRVPDGLSGPFPPAWSQTLAATTPSCESPAPSPEPRNRV